MHSRELADRYIANVREKNLDGMMTLFAEDAVFVTPDSREFAGAAAIRALYTQLFAANLPPPSIAAAVASANEAAIEITAQLPDGSTRCTANFYHLNSAGLIQRLSTYRRG